MHPSDILLDPDYKVPTPDDGPTGTAWLRRHVARFSDGADHVRRRALVEEAIAGLDARPERGEDPTACLVRALGLLPSAADDVGNIAAAYHPHQTATPAADAAVERLVGAFGARDETVAAKICILVQAHAATRALIDVLRAGEDRPPVPGTRRVAPDGTTVEVDLSDAHFGRGAHACPGEALGRRLAQEALR